MQRCLSLKYFALVDNSTNIFVLLFHQTRRMKFTLTAVASLLFLLTAQAQRTVTGKLIDSASKTPLALATISLFKAKDTALIADPYHQ